MESRQREITDPIKRPYSRRTALLRCRKSTDNSKICDLGNSRLSGLREDSPRYGHGWRTGEGVTLPSTHKSCLGHNLFVFLGFLLNIELPPFTNLCLKTKKPRLTVGLTEPRTATYVRARLFGPSLLHGIHGSVTSYFGINHRHN